MDLGGSRPTSARLQRRSPATSWNRTYPHQGRKDWNKIRRAKLQKLHNGCLFFCVSCALVGVQPSVTTTEGDEEAELYRTIHVVQGET